MKSLKVALLTLALAGCASLHLNRDQKKLAGIIERHPELVARDTIRDTVTIEVPRIEFQRVFVPVPDTARQRVDRAVLDSLLSQVELSLDSVQRLAARQQIQRFVARRPVLYDTLCFDTLGVMGRVWRNGHTYQLWLVRKSLTVSKPTQVVVERLKPCPDAPTYSWYDPRGWTWWWLLMVGFLTGAGLTWGVFSLALRTTR